MIETRHEDSHSHPVTCSPPASPERIVSSFAIGPSPSSQVAVPIIGPFANFQTLHRHGYRRRHDEVNRGDKDSTCHCSFYVALRRIERSENGPQPVVYIANEWFASNWSVKSTRPVIRSKVYSSSRREGAERVSQTGPTLTRCATRTDPQWNDLLRDRSFLPRNCERWLMWERSTAIRFVSFRFLHRSAKEHTPSSCRGPAKTPDLLGPAATSNALLHRVCRTLFFGR